MNIECVYEKSKRKPASAVPGSRPASTPTVVGPSQPSVAERPFEVQQSIESNQPGSPSVSVSSVTEPNQRVSSGHNLLVEYVSCSCCDSAILDFF